MDLISKRDALFVSRFRRAFYQGDTFCRGWSSCEASRNEMGVANQECILVEYAEQLAACSRTGVQFQSVRRSSWSAVDVLMSCFDEDTRIQAQAHS